MHQASQSVRPIALDPAAGGTERKPVRSHDVGERDATFQKRLDEMEALKASSCGAAGSCEKSVCLSTMSLF